MTSTLTTTRRRSLMRRGALGLGGAALVIGAGFAAAPAQAADTGIPALEQIKTCESGGDYTAVNASSGASGAYQFLDSTWQSLSASAGYATASSAPESVQDAAAIELYNAQGTTPWAASESCWSGAVTSSTGAADSSDSAAATTEDTAASEVATDESVLSVQDVAGAQEVSAPQGEPNFGAPADGQRPAGDQAMGAANGFGAEGAPQNMEQAGQPAGAAC
ncbi:transglycosylase family protein [Kocuria sp.]|uniref:transglycosylase family protein n=1 Tax=Kocuria sp. TaxID=1871328 RepID=UPI0026E0BD7C|nr:transglycosylase family protein [Kocuria sp.]MDO5619182.1 transglycosylase family protein [Kocuria sp.]